MMSLLRYVARRLLQLVPVLLGVSVIVFLIAHALPGNPAYLFVGLNSTPQQLAYVMHSLGLDKPLPVQYWIWITGILHGNWGQSWFTSQPVLRDLATRFPATFELTSAAMLIAVVVAIPLGVASAVWKDSWVDHVIRGVTVLGVCMPSFWLALLLIFVGFYILRILPPPTGRIAIGVAPPPHVTGLYLVDSLIAGDWNAFVSSAQYLVAPAVALAFVSLAPLARLVRSSMLEVLRSDFIRAARASGIPGRRVYLRYGLRNAMIAPLTMIALVYGNLLGNDVIIEQIFGWPGVGQYALQSITYKDYDGVQGFVLIMAALYVLIFLLTDIAYFWIDPRIRARLT